MAIAVRIYFILLHMKPHL